MLGRPRLRLVHPARAAGLLVAALLLILAALPARAQIGSDRYSSMVIDAANGRVLWSANPDAPRHPASLAKMMTLYMAFEALRDRRISLNQLVPVSPHAASMVPTKLDLVPGTRITVQEAILGMVTLSANDAAVALGELLGGDEDRFAQMMTLRARALGMQHTELRNASGLPDPDQWTTARDLTILARHLIYDFPNDYRYFSIESFSFHGRTIRSHDYLLKSYPGADGIKTGYTDSSGSNLVTSAMRDNVRLIGVVLGAAHASERDLHMAALLDQGFTTMDVAPPPRHDATRVASREMPSLIAAAHAATLQPPPPPPSRAVSKWGVQVGAFASAAAARQAALTARRVVDGGEIRIEAAPAKGKATAWRAQLTGLSAAEAREGCVALAKRKMPCVPLNLGAAASG
jgi:D-alanyl-D-alanine carboxypeptidase